MDLYSESKELFEYTKSLRRDFHMHPELGFQEIRTSGIVASELASLGIEVTTGFGKTGVVGMMVGDQRGPTILLRADMDALPITEETGAEYASQSEGTMHACGHDAHTAMLLTVARLLHAHANELHGTVKFMFQPAEEGMGGAESMIEAGVLDNPRPDIALAVHVWNELPSGHMCIGSGPIMAGAEIFNLKVIGRGGHGAIPQLAIDPIVASSQIITALQSIISRNTPPLKTAVVSVCTIHGGDTFNVIPSSVEMSGTIRTFDPDVRHLVLDRFHKTVTATAEALGCKVEIDLKRLTPATVNDNEVALRVQSIARQSIPDVQLITSNYTTMGSEDFSYILEKVPGCFIFVGTADPTRGGGAPHHHPKFDIDETALPRAVALVAATVMEYLSSPAL